MIIAILQAIGFRPSPINQRVTVVLVLIIFAFKSVSFISGKAHKLDYRFLAPKLFEILGNKFLL